MNETAKKSWFGRHKIISAVLILFVIAGIGSAMSSKDDVKVEDLPVIQVSAVDLYNEYAANEIAAEEKYNNSMVEVTGVLDSIAIDLMDNMYVTLQTNQLLSSVQCYLKDTETEKASTLTAGQTVTLSGEPDGMIITNVQLKNCIIQ